MASSSSSNEQSRWLAQLTAIDKSLDTLRDIVQRQPQPLILHAAEIAVNALRKAAADARTFAINLPTERAEEVRAIISFGPVRNK